MIYYKRVLQAAIITMGTNKGDVYILAENASKTTTAQDQTEMCTWTGWITCVFMSVCMQQACLPMQSSTDGRVGGWVLSAHRSSCGSVVPLLFNTQARRACQTRSTETCQGWILCSYACVQEHAQRNRLFTENRREINSATVQIFCWGCSFWLRDIIMLLFLYGLSAAFIGHW